MRELEIKDVFAAILNLGKEKGRILIINDSFLVF